jgi:hypothetical protein
LGRPGEGANKRRQRRKNGHSNLHVTLLSVVEI